RSFSNISTTLLGWAAVEKVRPESEACERARVWIRNYVGSDESDAVAQAVLARYGKDRTFAVPILMMCAICQVPGANADAWRYVLPLPFEVAVFPRKLFAALRLPVVSYALPALIAIGHARFHHLPPPPPLRWIRKWTWSRANRLLQRIQPASGGFLEATPLTSFVTMALAVSGESANPVVKNGIAFIRSSMREDGSWPIDTNLATWVTTLSVKAIGEPKIHLPDNRQNAVSGPSSDQQQLRPAHQERVREWILKQQFKTRHPYTDAAPGGWAWTDLSGGVPDADDTSGALLALHALKEPMGAPIEAGLTWLLDLQNRDGGIPTFCKGWGAFPFDRSSADITAHALRAFATWKDKVDTRFQKRINRATARALRFLAHGQSSDGYWEPLWFGNQHSKSEVNRLYGTSMVLVALGKFTGDASVASLVQAGHRWLLDQQNEDGGWGGERGCPSSLEETALALEALAGTAPVEVLERGVDYLNRETRNGTRFLASPIGFYFAKLWYYEEIYPCVWVMSALQRVSERLKSDF
ncbi:MAG: squalene--hopene cyclase, partial [Verrucomicrobiae bacterium]|nr:squalene--hopene cyclase [Verrucomicrobiae bacterium]